ncbi:MAG: lmo0937 family membrane protein [Dehalococcoidia bacterium]
MLWLIFVVLLVLWLVGFAVDWGAFIWLLLVAAAVILLINLLGALTGGRRY